MPTTRVVKRIHFEDFDGVDFERLVFAYLLRAGWTDLAWFGQTGSDLGRDIIGHEPVTGGQRRTVVQCVNRASLTKAKTERDMGRAVQAPSGVPEAMRFICRSNVSSERRDQVRTAGVRLGIAHTDVWSGVEFEEHLRRDGEQLLKRFIEGVVFPDDPKDLRRFVDDHPEATDEDMLTMLAAVLDRPALRTPFMMETQLPAFEQAIEDTIEAFNTGLWRTRDGSEIRRVPSRHHIRSVATRRVLDSVVACLDEVRRAFQRGLASGDIRPCGCRDAGCHMFEISPAAARALDAARTKALSQFAGVHPAFDVRLG